MGTLPTIGTVGDATRGLIRAATLFLFLRAVEVVALCTLLWLAAVLGGDYSVPLARDLPSVVDSVLGFYYRGLWYGPFSGLVFLAAWPFGGLRSPARVATLNAGAFVVHFAALAMLLSLEAVFWGVALLTTLINVAAPYVLWRYRRR